MSTLNQNDFISLESLVKLTSYSESFIRRLCSEAGVFRIRNMYDKHEVNFFLRYRHSIMTNQKFFFTDKRSRNIGTPEKPILKAAVESSDIVKQTYDRYWEYRTKIAVN